jgi:hypothetical protein
LSIVSGSAGERIRGQVFQELMAPDGATFVSLLALPNELFHFRMLRLSGVI